MDGAEHRALIDFRRTESLVQVVNSRYNYLLLKLLISMYYHSAIAPYVNDRRMLIMRADREIQIYDKLNNNGKNAFFNDNPIYYHIMRV